MGEYLEVKKTDIGRIKVSVGYPFPHDILFPERWDLFRFEEIVEITGGSQPPKSFFINEIREGYIRLIQIRDYKSNKYIVYIPHDKARRFCSKDDVMIGRYGPPIFQILRGLEGAYNVALMKADPRGRFLNKEYLYYYLRHPNLFRYIDSGSHRSSGQTGVNKAFLKDYPFPLPPLPEQQRIVAKLDSLFGKLEQVKSRLEKIPTLLQNFRQAILAQAVKGKLTEEWREGKELECIDDFVARVKLDINLDYQKRCKEANASGLRKPKDQKKNKRSEKGDVDLDLLPLSWRYERAEEVSYLITDGVHFKPTYTIEGTPFLSVKNVRPFKIKEDDCKYVSNKDHLEYIKRCNPENGDILYTKVGATYGYAAKIDFKFEFSIYVSLALIKPSKLLNSDYLEILFNSPLIFNQARNRVSGSGVPDLHLIEIRDFKLSIPPIEEQAEIVQRVGKLLIKADAIEAKYKTLKAQIDQLPQAILAKAFKGELVEQLPTDGDAKDLLKEIQELKAAAANAKKKATKRVTAKY